MPANSAKFARTLIRARNTLAQNPARAGEMAASAAASAEIAEDWQTAAQAYRVLAQALRLQSKHLEALAIFDAAAQSAERAGNPLLTLQVQVGRVDSLGMTGNIAEAFRFGTSLIAGFLALNAPNEAARVCLNLGILHYRQDQYREALDRYAQAAGILERQESDLLSRSSLYLNRANALTALNRLDEAESDLEQARLTAERADWLPYAATADINHGYLRYTSGRYAEALPLIERARATFESIGDEEGTAQCDADMSEIYRALNLAPEARECGQRAAIRFAALGLDYDSARAERGTAAALSLLGSLPEASAALDRAEIIFRRQHNRIQLAHLQLQQAALKHSAGDDTGAIAVAETAKRAFARAKLSVWVAEASFIAEQARESRGDAVSVRRVSAILRSAQRSGRGALEARSALLLGLAYRRRGDGLKALRSYRIAVNALEQARTLIAPEELHTAFLRDKMAIYEEIVGFLLARNRPRDWVEALEMVERAKSRLLLERVQSALSDRNGSSPLRRRLAALRSQLSQAYFRERTVGENAAERRLAGGVSDRPALAVLEQEYHSLLRISEQKHSDGTVLALSPAQQTRSLQAALSPDETLLEFFTFGDTICAFILTRHSITVIPNLGRVSEIAHAARRLRFQLQRAAGTPDFHLRHAAGLLDETRQSLAVLYRCLLSPLESELPSGKLTVVPHGILHGLPFPAFVDAAGEYALNRWEWVFAPSAALWYQCKQKRSQDKIPSGSPLLFGVPGRKLRGVSREIARLGCVLPSSQRYCGKHATRANFQEHAPSASLIHLAAHAEFRADNPLFSGVRLADGYLLARDLYGMRLNCDLATLAACQTATSRVEPGDEQFGILRGFLAAGAKSVAASLWAVDDHATSHLMTYFYEELQAGRSKAAALRAAQQATLQTLPHPYHWAAFILVGERGIESKRKQCQ